VKPKRHRPEDLSTFERQMMLAMGLADVDKLDELLSAPTSQEAAAHSEPPDEEYELAERMYQEADRQREAQENFAALFDSEYLN
jgi:hypothetical protein